MDDAEIRYNKKGMEELFELEMKEITLSVGELYLISDDWLRGVREVMDEKQDIGVDIGYVQ